MAVQPVGHSNRSLSCTSVGIIMVHFMSNQLLLLTNSISKLFLACFFKIDFSSVVHCTFYLYLINFSLLFKGTRYSLITKYPLSIIYMCSIRKTLTHIFTITKSKLLYGTLKIEPPLVSETVMEWTLICTFVRFYLLVSIKIQRYWDNRGMGGILNILLNGKKVRARGEWSWDVRDIFLICTVNTHTQQYYITLFFEKGL